MIPSPPLSAGCLRVFLEVCETPCINGAGCVMVGMSGRQSHGTVADTGGVPRV